jgi:tRNA pseudouridine38-40 synthase
MREKPFPRCQVALWCWYHGGPFRGYQTQVEGPTVQGTIEQALRAAGFSRNPINAGRTDLGVHARMQVLSMRVVEPVPPTEVAQRLNAHLPAGVGIACSRPAPWKWNAQWHSTLKEYRYRLALDDRPDWAPFAWRVDLDPHRLTTQLEKLRGARDFFAFHDKGSSRIVRTLTHVSVQERVAGVLEVRLVGDGFARYMVRFMVGAAVAVAQGTLDEATFDAAVLHAAPFAKRRAPAHGLILWDVGFPPELDPFTELERLRAPGVPEAPPFT